MMDRANCSDRENRTADATVDWRKVDKIREIEKLRHQNLNREGLAGDRKFHLISVKKNHTQTHTNEMTLQFNRLA